MAELMPPVSDAWKQFDEDGKRIIPADPPIPARPIVGQSVLYASEDGRVLQASILQVFADDTVELVVHDPLRAAGRFHASPVSRDETTKAPGTWCEGA